MGKVKLLIQELFGRKWWWVTLLVLALMIVLARLGIWQLDRLQQRRESNAVLAATLAASPLDLAQEELPADVTYLKDRQVIAAGEFDFEHQVMLKVQNWEGRAGAHLITPLVLDGERTAVLVDRGWIPEADNNPDSRDKYNVPGETIVKGVVALSQRLPNGRSSAPVQAQDQWYRVDIEAIQQQMPFELLPLYILQEPGDNDQPPFRSVPENEISEGNHFSYAIQWFIFSLGLGIAYIVYVHKQLRESERL
ncbi:MAG: SURF1 family protein [Candidatus Promineifilaceae bacterium]|nr:SURF1 family protein [Candidatus Promineifilaceae bacterium]